jgi:histidinol dehydrogenase
MRDFSTRRQSIERIADAITPRLPEDMSDKDARVREIIDGVRTRGDAAICEYIQRFDGAKITPGTLKVREAEFRAACKRVGKDFAKALAEAEKNIRNYHKKQRLPDWFDLEHAGAVLGEKFTPIEKVGLHIPGASAPLSSSVLMTVIPAQEAGVKEIHVATPPARDGSIHPATLAALEFLGVKSVFKMAGAQAIAAFAFGTKIVPKVDKVAGPGNVYATLAKRQVYGIVGIDGLYGPSEVVVLADAKANPAWVAADLLAQAEHRSDSCAIVISPSSALLEKVKKEITSQARKLPRKEFAWESWRQHGAVVLVKDLAEGVALSNLIAPEHLELQVEEPLGILGEVKNAGCILLGAHAPAPVGDYAAGPSHVLPTGRSATFSSGLGVMDFMKRSSVVYLNSTALEGLAETIRQFASLEGLEAHNRAVQMRLRPGAARKAR